LFVSDAVAAGSNVTGLASYTARLVDDAKTSLTGKGFFSKDTRDDLSNIGTVAGTIAGVASMGAAAAQASIDEAQTAAKAAAAANPPVGPASNTAPNGNLGDQTVVNGQLNPTTNIQDVDVNPNRGGQNNEVPPTDVNQPVITVNRQPGQQPPLEPLAGPRLAVPLPPGGGAPLPQLPAEELPLNTVVHNNLEGSEDNVVKEDAGVKQAVQQVKVRAKSVTTMTPRNPISESQATVLQRTGSARFSPRTLRSVNN
jgi:hypothetical protein